MTLQSRWSPPVAIDPLLLAGAPSVVVDSMQLLFGGRIGWCPDTTPLENIEVFKGLASGSDVAVTVELETPFLFVVPLVEGE